MSKTFDDIINAGKVFNDDIACFWDAHAKLFVLLERNGNILAALDYHIEQDMIARVQQSGSLQGHCGYGYTIYLYTMAALGPKLKLCADTTELTPGALALWTRLYDIAGEVVLAGNNDEALRNEPGLLKYSLLNTQAYREVMDENLDEASFITNPDLVYDEWSSQRALQQVLDGKLHPHICNWGFTLTDNYRQDIAKRVHVKRFTSLQQRMIHDYLTCAFQLAPSQYMIPITLPKRSQTKLVE